LPYNRSLLPYHRSLLTLTHTSGPCTVLLFFDSNSSIITIIIGGTVPLSLATPRGTRVRVFDLDPLSTVLKQDCNESFCTPDFPEHLCHVNCRCWLHRLCLANYPRMRPRYRTRDTNANTSLPLKFA